MSPGVELSPILETKKRPPPITIPAQPPSRLVTGPSILAMTERTEREEAERQAGNAFYQQAKRSASSTPKLSPVDGSRLPLPLRTGSHATKDRQRTSGMSTFTQFIDHARSGMSPRKSEVSGHTSSTMSRHSSTARSRHSEHSNRAGRSTNQLEDNGMTSRADIEGRAEKKLFKMMGQVPSTPTSETPEGVYLTTYDLSSQGSKKKPEEHIKSPKKKLFGVTLPGFMSSMTPTHGITEPVPPMPSKAAQVLGATPASKSKRLDSPKAYKTPRSDTSKSLPSKVYNQHSHGRRPNTSGSTQIHPRAPSRKTHSPVRESPGKGFQWHGVKVMGKPGGSLDLGIPPTPPQKDTPPHKDSPGEKENIALAYIHPAFRTTVAGDEENEPRDLFIDGGMRVQLPYLVTTAELIPSEGGESPSKFCPYGAEDYAKLIEAERTGSAHVLFDYTPSSVEDGNHNAPLNIEKHAAEALGKERWIADDHARYSNRLSQRLSDLLQELPPAFYSPSSYSRSLFEEGRPSKNTDQNRLLFAFPPNPDTTFSLKSLNCGDIGVVFKGTASEVDQNSNMSNMINGTAQESVLPRKSDEPRLSLAHEPQGNGDQFSGRVGGSSYLNPEQSSSRLTEILSDVSPSKTEFNHDFFANCPSAVPSPLHRMPGQQTPNQQVPNQQQMPHPMMMGPSPGPTGTPHSLTWAQHFHMTNEHIDVSGRTLYDFVAECNLEQIVTSNSKHDKTVEVLEERFNDIKLHFESVNNEVDRVHDQTHSINEKLDKLLDYIKKEVVEPLTVQSKKTADMETSIKALQKSMFDLERSVEAKLYAVPGPGPSAHVHYPLPHHPSQPSLVGSLYDSPNDVNQIGSSRLASIQEATNGGRFRYQSWNRSQTNVRDDSKTMQHPFTAAANTYNNLSSNHGGANGGGGGGYMGGYPGYSYPGTPEQSYNYNQGAPK